MKQENIHPVDDRLVPRAKREQMYGHKALALWFTGLSGAGKSTLVLALERKMTSGGYLCQVLDGDNLRNGLNRDLGFSEADRLENIRRAAELAKLLLRSGIIPLCAFVSPTAEMRQLAKEIIGPGEFLEVYVKAPLEVCEARDVKGLYRKAKEGGLSDFTGLQAPYEEPQSPDFIIDTVKETVEEACDRLVRFFFPKLDLA